jgi:hypothetical protein
MFEQLDEIALEKFNKTFIDCTSDERDASLIDWYEKNN